MGTLGFVRDSFALLSPASDTGLSCFCIFSSRAGSFAFFNRSVSKEGAKVKVKGGGRREAKQNEGINGQPRASKTTAKIDTQADAHRYTDTDECRRRCKAVLASFPHTPLMEADGGEG